MQKIHKTLHTITLQGAAEIAKHQFDKPSIQTRAEAEWGIHTEADNQESVLVEAIQCSTTVVVSDRSFQNQAGLAAWTIESKNKSTPHSSYGCTPSLAKDQSTYCSELFGL